MPVTHGNVGAPLDTNQECYRLTPDGRVTQTFDLSVFDLFMAGERHALPRKGGIALISKSRRPRRARFTAFIEPPQRLSVK